MEAKSGGTVHLIATGGTIASVPSAHGLVPGFGGAEILRYCQSALLHYDIEIEDLLNLDSSNIQPEEWQIMARAVARALTSPRPPVGIVITHGTDTMAYTAAALSYMLVNLPLPVVLTGSQLPITDPLSDATANLAAALAMATSGVPGVFLAFDRQILLGTRAVKVRTTGFAAFESINHPIVGHIGGDGLVLDHSCLPPPVNGPFRLEDAVDASVMVLKLSPGFDPGLLEALPARGCRALVLEAFGIGGVHELRRNLLTALESLIAAGLVVVVGSQCLYERSDFRRYAVGRSVLERGAVPAFDMTTESCVAKLITLLGRYRDPAEVARRFREPVCGDIQSA
ncbi:MAG: asparaginase [Bacillota bacterium]|nr:asparaginase [Bacillota bacterium]